MVTVIIAAKINTTVAIIDRIENRLIPHTPCPLVQPLPILVPIPTNNPPNIIIGIEVVIEKGIVLCVNIIKIIGPNIRPNKNNKFTVRLCGLVRELLTILLTPANLPLETKKRITPIPINTPPKKEENGVKFIKSTLIISFFF